jgi:hypothetical protein
LYRYLGEGEQLRETGLLVSVIDWV